MFKKKDEEWFTAVTTKRTSRKQRRPWHQIWQGCNKTSWGWSIKEVWWGCWGSGGGQRARVVSCRISPVLHCVLPSQCDAVLSDSMTKKQWPVTYSKQCPWKILTTSFRDHFVFSYSCRIKYLLNISLLIASTLHSTLACKVEANS